MKNTQCRRVRVANTAAPGRLGECNTSRNQGPAIDNCDSQDDLAKKQPKSQLNNHDENPPPRNASLTAQLETRPTVHGELVRDIEDTYKHLVIIEAKCVEVVDAQLKDINLKLDNYQWQALFTLHGSLFERHHDFCLIAQHPAASDALRRLVRRYSMPTRLWKCGIEKLLELLRKRLPDSYEVMLNFIYLAYSWIALFYETVTHFKDTWVECLGDIARYRMAIENIDLECRGIWNDVAREWYCLASEKAPTTGRLYHHLAVLAYPNAVQQLYYYTKSLCVVVPFDLARESIMTLFDRVLGTEPILPAIDIAFVRIHGMFFSEKTNPLLEPSIEEYLELLGLNIDQVGYWTAIPLCCCLLGYGRESHFVMKEILRGRKPGQIISPVPEPVPDEAYEKSLAFTMGVFQIVASRFRAANALSFIHTFMVFIHHLSKYPRAMVYIQASFPWELCATMLNYILQSCDFRPRLESQECLSAMKKDIERPLPEDWALRGIVYAEGYFPNGNDWFKNSKVEVDRRDFKIPSMGNQRRARILWLGRQISRSGRWLTWDETGRDDKFGVAKQWMRS